MRKSLFLIGVLSLLLIGGVGTSYAVVTGLCSDCHTMHNSQGGATEAVDELTGDSTTPYAHLTKSNCIGCHVEANGGIPAPKIDGEEGADMTAGGTFDIAEASTNAKRHDVITLATYNASYSSTGDPTFSAVPGAGTSPVQSLLPSQLTCAGGYGCHGDATATPVGSQDAGIAGFHHGSKTGYRYLQYAADQTGIGGLGSSDWEEAGALSNNHNIYSAETGNVSISTLCANCHGEFHGAGGMGSSPNWIRHPTDVPVPSGWTYTVNPETNPLAFSSITSQNTADLTGYTNDGTAGQVACISCHRAHGSKYDDILRFEYSPQHAGSTTVTTGCLGCHSKQRG